MRKIKFRALYKKEWVYFDIDDLICINYESMSDKEYSILYHDSGTRCEFTGLLDKNSKEIYEGDIVLLHNASKNTKKEYWYPIYEVEYKTIGFYLKYIGAGLNNNSFMFDLEHYSNKFEVIGNVYINSELLNN